MSKALAHGAVEPMLRTTQCDGRYDLVSSPAGVRSSQSRTLVVLSEDFHFHGKGPTEDALVNVQASHDLITILEHANFKQNKLLPVSLIEKRHQLHSIGRALAARSDKVFGRPQFVRTPF